MPSKPSTASVIDTANPEAIARLDAVQTGPAHPARSRREHRRGGWPFGTRLGQRIVFLNLLGLVVIIIGSLVLNELRQGLVQARLSSLTIQGRLIAGIIDQAATRGEPAPALDGGPARQLLRSVDLPATQRARLYDAQGRLLADSNVAAGRTGAPLDQVAKARLALTKEVAGAVSGVVVADVRMGADGRRVVSVSLPIRRGSTILGALTLEANDVDSIIAAQRRALAPIILVATGVALLSSMLLTQWIAVPVLRLARAADQVRLSRARAIALPDLAEREDELGDLTRSLESMTVTLSERLVAIERFAADVAHELRNPMTSIRSAVETLEIVKTDEARHRLVAILQNDIGRLDRLITDISNASRLDAELARAPNASIDLARLLSDICDFYTATARPTEPGVRFAPLSPADRTLSMRVVGREGPLGQVFRNLVDNARSFSAAGGEVRVSVTRSLREVLAQVDDDGPGIPPDNLETVFERFYTSRPKGAAFGGNSGLGLAIARQIVEAHGGRIWAENRQEEGRVIGASFRVALPLA